MRGFRKAIAIAVASASVVLFLPGSANAYQSADVACTAGGDTIHTDIIFYADGTAIRVDWYDANITGNTNTHNNVNLKFAGNGGADVYLAWNSPDSIVGGQYYAWKIVRYGPRSANPYVRFQGIFDQFGSDPSCYAYHTYLRNYV